MSNPIKYSTGTESLALKKGNFYIGTGDVGKGPTSTTGYYNGITPPTGGYTIYLNKESGGPSIYTVSNDTQLISLTNSIAGQSYTTVNECLVYFAGQTDKVCLNRDYEGIVTNGLVFNLDAGFTPSYSRSGTTWYDVGGTNNGTLINGPTFNSSNGGSIVFDGSNDYVSLLTFPSFASAATFSVFVMKTQSKNSAGVYSFKGCMMQFDNDAIRFWFDVAKVNLVYNFTPTLNQWYYITITQEDYLNKIYIDGSLVNTQTTSFPLHSGFYVKREIGTYNDRYFLGMIPIVQVYNRALSADEVLQNFNAQKGRFGL
jgi:hypothetical protein